MTDPQLEAVVQWLATRTRPDRPAVIGLNGAQGSGKSTLALRLRQALTQAGLRSAILSIDDLYLTHAEREALAAAVHPLLRTRGVPGTHAVALGLQLLQALANRGAAAVPMPRFVKAQDDRAPRSEWPQAATPLDLILFEGWCVGTPPQDDAALRLPVNALEAREDADGTWRKHVNQQLAGPYAELFAAIDQLIFLKAPDFDSIHRWRLQQESGNAAEGRTSGMDAEALRRFIQHYERLTLHALRVMPERADLVIELGAEHEWQGLLWR